MNPRIFTSPERLEERIAPAGLVTTTFLAGLLTINGADGADHEVHIVKTGVNTFRVDGIATGINDVTHSSQSFRGVLTGVHIEGGAGADNFQVSNLDPLKTFVFNGQAGVDTLSTANLQTTLGGRVDIDLGTETGTIDFFGSRTAVHGPLNINLGGGGSVGFHSAVTAVDSHVTITGGVGSDSVAITGEATVFRRNLTFNAGGGDDFFSASGGSLTVQGVVMMDGGPGSNQFTFGARQNIFGTSLAPGLVSVKLGVGPGNVTFLGAATNVYGDLKIDLGTGGGTAQLNSAATFVRDNVLVTGGAGDDALGFKGLARIGKALSFVGDIGDDTFTASGGLLVVRGTTTMDGGSGSTNFDIHVTSLALAALNVTGGTVNDNVSIIADGTIAGDVNLQLGLDGIGPSSTLLQSAAGVANGLKFGGALTINMTGATVDFLDIANIQVAKGFTAKTGENVSTVNIAKVYVAGDFKLETGSGADVVNIDNINVRNFYVDTESGADGLRIERNAADLGASRVRGIATILAGIGADQIRIGDASDSANLKVNFMGAMTLDAGDGANMRNDVIGSNFFEAIPVITATGGTLTQTAAV